MSDETKKNVLRAVLTDVFPSHCTGCQPRICGGPEKNGSFHEPPEELLDQLLEIYKNWSKDEHERY